MPRPNAVGIRCVTTNVTVASATGLTALDSTTKAAFAAWARIPIVAGGTGGILHHMDVAAPGNGLSFRTAASDSMQVTSFNGSTATQMQAPRANGMIRYSKTGLYFHCFVTVDVASGKTRWYVDGQYIGDSTTAPVAWTTAGTRTTKLGTTIDVASIVDIYDVRHWAQNDADICIASPLSIARLAMEGLPAGESVRYCAYGANGVDASGHGRDLAWSGATGNVGIVDGPTVPSIVRERRKRRVAYVPATNAAPTASITAPATGSSAASGATVNFTGTGSDAEDGTLTGASLAWSSSRDGALGTGTAISSSSLSVGVHTITLTATDSLGATGSASITLTITGSGPSAAAKRRYRRQQLLTSEN